MKVAVIGAGIAGLSCAWDLHKAGVAVEVYEREATVGGRMNTRTKDGLDFDVGANFMIRAYRSVNGLADEMGVPLRRASPVLHRVYHGGEPHLMNFTSIRDIFRMDSLSLLGRIRFLAFAVKVRLAHRGLDFFDLGVAPEELNRTNAYLHAKSEVGVEFADYIVDSFNACMMFSRATETSAAASLSLFSMMADPAIDFSVLYAEGDMRAIPEALAARLVVHRNRAVRALERAESGWRVVAGDGEAVFDRVVLAATPSAALAMLKGAPEAVHRLLEQTRCAATINLAFRVPKDALGRTHCFYAPWIESPVISEFTNESLKGEHTTRDGMSLVNVGLHEEAALKLMDKEDGKIFEVVRAELLRLNHDLRAVSDRVIAHDLQRWPEAIPKYDCGQITRVKEFLRDSQGAEGLYLCGDYLNAPWIEGASRSGRKVAARLVLEAQRPSS